MIPDLFYSLVVERKVYGCYSVCQGNDERVFVQTEPLRQHYG